MLLIIVGALPSFAHATTFTCIGREALDNAELNRTLLAVEKRYASIKDLSAAFHQQSTFTGLNQTKASTGVVFFRSPGMMNWEYTKPVPQIFVGDGTVLWFYQPDLNQVTLSDFKRSFSTELPVSFLLGLGKVGDNFKAERGCRFENLLLVELVPLSPDPNLSAFHLLVDAKDHTPRGAKVIDVGGNETTILFEEVKLNSNVPLDRFAFTVPKGVDVIDNRVATGPTDSSKRGNTVTESDLVSQEERPS